MKSLHFPFEATIPLPLATAEELWQVGDGGRSIEGPLKFQLCHITLSPLNPSIPCADGVSLRVWLKCAA